MPRNAISLGLMRSVKRTSKHWPCRLTLLLLAMFAVDFSASGAVLWSHPKTVLVCNNGKGKDILNGAIKPRDSNSIGTLYFRIKISPISDTVAKWIRPFEAGFMLVEKEWQLVDKRPLRWEIYFATATELHLTRVPSPWQWPTGTMNFPTGKGAVFDCAVFIPHWLVLLSVVLPWSALLLWRARRRNRISTP